MGTILSTCGERASPGEISETEINEGIKKDETNETLRRVIACLKEDNKRLQHEVSTIVTGEFTRPSMRVDKSVDTTTPTRLDGRPTFIAELLAVNPGSPLIELWKKDLALSELQGVYVEQGEVIGLDLTSQKIQRIPKEISKLQSLEILILSHNQLERVCTEVGELKRLRKLYLDNNRLESIPKELCDSSKLQSLWLHGNKLRNLPVEICQMVALRQLLVSDNRLESLPEDFGSSLSNLKSLWLQNNELETLPESLNRFRRPLHKSIGDGQIEGQQ